MKLVSASKLRKARLLMEANKPYTEELEGLIKKLSKQAEYKQDFEIIFGRTERVKKNLFVVVGSERGLCGAFNQNLAREVHAKAKLLEERGETIVIECIGSKIYDLLKFNFPNTINLIHKKNSFVFQDMQQLAGSLIEHFTGSLVDGCFIFYSKFYSRFCIRI